jgi:hypothetical protein
VPCHRVRGFINFSSSNSPVVAMRLASHRFGRRRLLGQGGESMKPKKEQDSRCLHFDECSVRSRVVMTAAALCQAGRDPKTNEQNPR